MAVKAVYIELLEESQAPCLKAKLEETKAELAATQAKLSALQANGGSISDNSELEGRIAELGNEVNGLTEQLNAALSDAAFLQTSYDNVQQQLRNVQAELEECRNTQAVPPAADWQFTDVVVMQNNEVVTAVVTVSDANAANASSDIRVPNYFWVDGGGSTLDVLSVKTVGSSTTALIQLNSNHGKRVVNDGAVIEIAVTDGPRSGFTLNRIVGTDDTNAVYKAVSGPA